MRTFTKTLPVQILALLAAACSTGTDDESQPSGYGIDAVVESATAVREPAVVVRNASLPTSSLAEVETERDGSTMATHEDVDHLALGREAWERGDHAEAAEHLRVATEGGDATPYDAYLFGLSLWKSGDLDGAEAALDRAARTMTGFARAPVNLARVRLEKGDVKGAREAIEEALSADPDFAPAHNVHGRALLKDGDRDGAAEAFRRAAEADQSDPWPLNNLGYLFIVTGRADEAIAPLEESVARDEELAPAWHNLALARERAGDLSGAAAAAERASALEDGSSDYRATAARLAALAPAAPGGPDASTDSALAPEEDRIEPVGSSDVAMTTSPSP